MNAFVTKTDQQLFGHPVFGGAAIEIPAIPDCRVPPENSGYVFRLDTLRVVLNFLMNGSRIKQGMYLFGPSGTGKTSVVEQVHARLGIPLLYECAADELTWTDLVGSFQFTQPGVMEYVYGSLALAYKNGWGFLLDELDRWDVPAKFYGVLEGKPLALANGEIIHKHPDFRLYATGNTAGQGDMIGKYRNTRQQNEALMQRFDCLEVQYPDADVEVAAVTTFLADISDMDDATRKDFAIKMVQVAKLVRGQMVGDGDLSGTIEIDFSTRTLLSWSENMVNFQGLAKQGVSPLFYGLDRAVLSRAQKPTQEAITQIVKDVFGI